MTYSVSARTRVYARGSKREATCAPKASESLARAPRHDVIVAEPLASPDADARLGAHDAGRFCGLMGATLMLIDTRALDVPALALGGNRADKP